MAVSVTNVLSSAKFIASRSKYVKINSDGVQEAAKTLLCAMHSEGLGASTGPYIDPLEPAGLSQEEALEWLFLLDTLNFCFWSDEEELFAVDFRGRRWTGYRSLCAALCRAVESGVPVYSPSFYSTMTTVDMRELFRSDTHLQLPLLERRLENLHEASTVLSEKFDGKVSELIRRSDKSASRLVQLLFEHFPSYRDASTYKGREVYFLKRAQIFAADVWQRFGGCGYGAFHDINSLTMFADYRVPQSLLFLRVLQYDAPLMERLKRGDHLEVGSPEEIEIRGCSVWAVEQMKKKLLELLAQDDGTARKLTINSVMIDYYLWNYAKAHSNSMSHIPIHRTLTVFY